MSSPEHGHGPTEPLALVELPPTETPDVAPDQADGQAKDSKPRRRPTTRAGRAAAKQARAAASGQAKPDKTPNRKSTQTGTAKDVALAVQGLHELLGGVVLPMAALPTTGAALAASGPDAGEVWGQLSRRYPAIARLFTGAGDGMLFVKLLMVYYPVIMAAMAEQSTPREERAAMAQAVMAATMAAASAEQPATGG